MSYLCILLNWNLFVDFFYILYNICIYYLYFKISFIIPWVCFISLVFSPEFPWKAVPQRLMVLPSRQQGASYPLIPRASPPVLPFGQAAKPES